MDAREWRADKSTSTSSLDVLMPFWLKPFCFKPFSLYAIVWCAFLCRVARRGVGTQQHTARVLVRGRGAGRGGTDRRTRPTDHGQHNASQRDVADIIA